MRVQLSCNDGPERVALDRRDGGKWGKRVKTRHDCNGAAKPCAVFIFIVS